MLITLAALLVASPAFTTSLPPPRFTEEARLLGLPDRSGFGEAVGLSRDSIVVGGPTGLDYYGLGFLFRRAEARWRGTPPWLAKLASSVELTNNWQAGGVAIQGRTIVTGAPLRFVNGEPYYGSAQVFMLSESASGTITESAQLRASDGAAWSYFGQHVAIDGDTVLVAAPSGDQSRGAVYVFVRPPGGWSGVITESARLVDPSLSNWSYFGNQIGISGRVVVVGVPGARYAGNLRSGAVYLYERPAGGWAGTITQANAKLVPRVPQDTDFIGEAVAISGDTVVIGAGRHTTHVGEEGAAYVFKRPEAGWQGEQNESAILMASDGEPEDMFGLAVAISGRAIVVTAAWDDIDEWNSGSLYVFTEPPGGWHGPVLERAMLVPSDPDSFDQFGTRLAIEGDTVLTSAPVHGVGWNYSQGMAYVFDAPLPRDFGDAPYPYPAALENDGARHQLSDYLFIGSCADSEEDAASGAAADGDDLDNGLETVGTCSHRNDDGITFSPLFVGSKGMVKIDVTNPSGATANLFVWIDWNRDGDWSDANELSVAADVAKKKGPYTFQVPPNAIPGSTFARVRLSTSRSLSPLGFAADGEVEDLEVVIRSK